VTKRFTFMGSIADVGRPALLLLGMLAVTVPVESVAQQADPRTLEIAVPAKAAVQSQKICRATGDPCFLGIDPDRYAMPLLGEYIQSGADLTCAMRSWTTLPPEAFDLSFVRAFWQLVPPADHAQVEAAAFYFVTTHWGPPDTPPQHLWDVATPKDFAGEVFSALEDRTTRIEFEVPKSDFEVLGWQATSIPVSIPPDPAPDVPLKLRGWYIRADGHGADGLRPDVAPGKAGRAPLIIISTGFPYSMAADYLVGGINPGEQTRKAITFFVASGYDVLIFDKRGHGFSQGLLDGMGEDVFRVLDQLEHGVIVEQGVELTLSIITPDGQYRSGAAAAAQQLLGPGYTARTKPIVLRGFSYGSSQLQKAMAMNYSDYPVEFRFTRDATGQVIVDPSRQVPGRRGYNFRGIVAISGFQGSVKYETTPYFLALDALASTVGHNGSTLKSTVYESMTQWPGFLGLYGTTDFETADGAIDAYNNMLRGFKEIRMVTSYHFGLSSPEVDTYFAAETERFAKQVVTRDPPPWSNYSTTTYAEEVCAAEQVLMDPATQSITGVPSKVIRDANQKVDAFLERWLKSELRARR
jgi:pimeloyl-ACP methyl ester carboxylesterase